jgi:hypothetical protein
MVDARVSRLTELYKFFGSKRIDWRRVLFTTSPVTAAPLQETWVVYPRLLCGYIGDADHLLMLGAHLQEMRLVNPCLL